MTTETPTFDSDFQENFHDLLAWRRDVRKFRTDALPIGLMEELIAEACLAPSVGNCQPWRFVLVEDKIRRKAIRHSFERCNAEALANYHGEKAKTYAALKLSGLDDAPVQLAVLAEPDPEAGGGLGRQTMPETVAYSVVGAVQTLWLAARAQGIGVGWVSILEPELACRTLDVPTHWQLIAYLCIGYPQEETTTPALVKAGWQERIDPKLLTFRR